MTTADTKPRRTRSAPADSPAPPTELAPVLALPPPIQTEFHLDELSPRRFSFGLSVMVSTDAPDMANFDAAAVARRTEAIEGPLLKVARRFAATDAAQEYNRLSDRVKDLERIAAESAAEQAKLKSELLVAATSAAAVDLQKRLADSAGAATWAGESLVEVRKAAAEALVVAQRQLGEALQEEFNLIRSAAMHRQQDTLRALFAANAEAWLALAVDSMVARWNLPAKEGLHAAAGLIALAVPEGPAPQPMEAVFGNPTR